MGVDRTDYILFGWKLPFQLKDKNGNEIDPWDEKLMPYIEGHKGVEYSFIVDGMCGDYCAFGKNMGSATDDGEGWGFTDLDFSSINVEEAKKLYVELFNLEIVTEPKLFIFSHYH